MKQAELISHLKSAYRQGAQAAVIADCRELATAALDGIASAETLADNDMAATLHLSTKELKLSKSQTAAAQCLSLCVRWQESPSDDTASYIFEAMHGFTSMSAAEREAAKQNAKKPRTASRAPLRAAITAAMRPNKNEGDAFKVFMARWAIETIGGLRAEHNTENGNYTITDENGDSKPDQYTWGTLEKMYSNSGNSYR